MVRSLNSTLDSYEPLVTHLATASHQNPKAEGLHKLLVSTEVLAFMIFLRDILEPLKMLSDWLQRKEATLADVHMKTNTALACLQDAKVYSKELQTVLESRFDGEKLMYKGKQLSGSTPKMACKEPVIDKLYDSLSARFADLNDDPVIQATKVASLHLWPTSLEQGFGDEAMETLYNHFNKQFEADSSKMLREWQLLKNFIYSSYGESVSKQTWTDIHKAMAGMGVENILMLVDLILALPPTSVENERAFSQLKLIKTDRRHRLGQSRLNHVMQIRLNGRSIETFNPDPAIDQWLILPSNSLRLNYKQKPKVKDATGDSTDVADDGQVDMEQICKAASMQKDTPMAIDEDSEYDSDIDSDCGYESFSEEDYDTNCTNIARFLTDV